MTAIPIPGGTFSENPHEYRDEQGVFVPSITQVLKLAGLSDFSGADPEDMQKAAERGTMLHELVESRNKYGEVDPSWITQEIEGYYRGYLQFLEDTGFVPDTDWVEAPVIARLWNMPLGLKTDLVGHIRKQKVIVELKAASTVQASWSVQTAGQELAVMGSHHVGQVKRCALQLFRDEQAKNYKIHWHENHQEDEGALYAALYTVYWRMRHGQKIWKMI